MILVAPVWSLFMPVQLPAPVPATVHTPHTQCPGIPSSQEASQTWTGVTCLFLEVPLQAGALVVYRQQHPLLSLSLLVSVSHSPYGAACASQISYGSQALSEDLKQS